MFGVINVTQTVAQARDFGAVLDQFFVAQGLGHYTDAAVADGAGIAVIASNVLALVLAIGFSVPRIRQKRTSFWIPLVCAAVSVVVTTALILAALVADPAFAAALQRPS